MENRKYKVCRDNIYVGQVVRAREIYRYVREDSIYGLKSGQLDASCYLPYRSILFVPDEQKLSSDLLYRSPNYPILNITDDDTCLKLLTESPVIKNACNLSELLKYFGWNEELAYEDIMLIRKTFFTGRFAQDNCRLFGYKECMAEDFTFYQHDRIVTNPKELEKRREEFRAKQKAGERHFTGISEAPLPREFFYLLDKLGDNALLEILLGFEERINAFTPHKGEGKIRKLSRF